MLWHPIHGKCRTFYDVSGFKTIPLRLKCPNYTILFWRSPKILFIFVTILLINSSNYRMRSWSFHSLGSTAWMIFTSTEIKGKVILKMLWRTSVSKCLCVCASAASTPATEGLPSKIRIKIIRGSLLRSSSLNFDLPGIKINIQPNNLEKSMHKLLLHLIKSKGETKTQVIWTDF